MIRKCGRDSKVPVIMAMDALAAGIDTTGNTGVQNGGGNPCNFRIKSGRC